MRDSTPVKGFDVPIASIQSLTSFGLYSINGPYLKRQTKSKLYKGNVVRKETFTDQPTKDSARRKFLPALLPTL